MSPKKDLAAVVADANWLPSHWDPSLDLVQFALVPRAMHARLTFLADEYLREFEPEVVSAPTADVKSHLGPPSTAPHYIFHSAFCRSTLLARALDIPGTVMGLKEPQIVNELAAAMLRHQVGEEVLSTIVDLLARPFGRGERVVIKPSNEANLLAPSLLELNEGSRAVFLYAPLERFLASLANKGMWGRIWARRLYSTLQREGAPQFGLTEAEMFALTDLQVGALAWLLHRAGCSNLVARFPARVRTLDSEIFAKKRAEALAAVGGHFELGLDESRWGEIANGPAFASHSKEIGRAFDPELAAEAEPSMPLVDEEIGMVSKWARAVADHVGLAVDLPPQSALVS